MSYGKLGKPEVKCNVCGGMYTQRKDGLPHGHRGSELEECRFPTTVGQARALEPLRRTGPIDWDAQPLGEVPDQVIARELEVTRSAVAAARRARNIEPCCRKAWRPRSAWAAARCGPDRERFRDKETWRVGSFEEAMGC